MSNPNNHEINHQLDGDMTNKQLEKLKNYTLIAYVCFGASFLIPFVPSIAAAILAYKKLDDTQGSIYYSHMQYIIKTFWLFLGLFVIGMTIFFILNYFNFLTIIIWLVLIAITAWAIYRLFKGIIALFENIEIDYDTWL